MLNGMFERLKTPFNTFENKENIVWMLNESLNRFKFDSIRFQQPVQHFLRFKTMLNHLFKRPNIWFNNCVERMLMQMLKPFKRALTGLNTHRQNITTDHDQCMFARYHNVHDHKVQYRHMINNTKFDHATNIQF